jgi:DNA-directed RNA polymerase specialized sigma24 family protein
MPTLDKYTQLFVNWRDNKDEKAFNLLYVYLKSTIYKTLVKNNKFADFMVHYEDIFQDNMMKLVTNNKIFKEGQSKILSYMYNIVCNSMIDLTRKKKHRDKVADIVYKSDEYKELVTQTYNKNK